MGRGDPEKAQQNATAVSQQGAGIAGAQTAAAGATIAGFQGDLKKFKTTGGAAFPDPWGQESYLRSQRLAVEGAGKAMQDADAQKLKDQSVEAGSNAASIGYNLSSMNRERQRSAAQYLAQLRVTDHDKYIDYQKQIIAMGLLPAGIQAQLAGTGGSMATGGAGAASQASGQPTWFDSLINTVITGASNVAAGFAGKPPAGA